MNDDLLTEKERSDASWAEDRKNYGTTQDARNLAMAAALRMRDLLANDSRLDPWDACAELLNQLESDYEKIRTIS